MDNVDTPYEGLSYDKTNFRNGVHESFLVPAAFGTGIGNRKITMSPEVRWNNMNVKNPPKWVNGNWEEATLGGSSSSFWDNSAIKTVLQIVIGCVLFIVIFLLLNYVYTYLTTGAAKMPTLSKTVESIT
jgi:hypothetical protein